MNDGAGQNNMQNVYGGVYILYIIVCLSIYLGGQLKYEYAINYQVLY